MVNRELFSHLSISQLIDPVTITADTDGASADLRDFDSALIAVAVGESGDTLNGSNYIELEVEESDDDSVWTDVADADLTRYVAGTNDGTFAKIDAAAEDDAVYITAYKGDKRYIRPVINVTGTHTTGTPIGAIAILGHPRSAPVNEPT